VEAVDTLCLEAVLRGTAITVFPVNLVLTGARFDLLDVTAGGYLFLVAPNVIPDVQ